MQITDKIKLQLNNWWEVLLPFIESEEWDKLFAFLKSQSALKKVIIPKSIDLFKSFEISDRHKVKAVIVMMDPYPSITKEGIMVADGIPMSCVNTGRLQPTLELFYGAIENSYLGFDPDMDMRPNISYLVKEEGVLLLNSSLSCEKDKPGSHAGMWTPFMKFFIEEVLNKYYRGLPIVLCGAQAQKLEKYIQPMLHHVKCIEHPVAASYQNRSWNYQDLFKWCNTIIESNNGIGHGVRWYRKKNESTEPLPEWVTKKTVIKYENTNTGKSDLPW